MKRLLTGLVLTPFFFYIVVFAPDWAFLAALAAVGLACYYEFLGIAARHLADFEYDPRKNPAGYLAGILLLLLPGSEMLTIVLFAFLMWIFALRAKNMAHILPFAAMATFGIVYIFGAWKCGLSLRLLNPWWMLFATAINWAGDTFAYYGGKNFGRRKLAPVLSPGKTWAGAIASLAGTLALGLWFLHWKFPHVTLWQGAALCLLANVSGQAGDLCESAIKRGAGVKDSGNSLPGHGGWLDRVDSSLFSVPVVYWLLHSGWIQP
ncbi:MAG: phosphatidate cytidylyltransferase [Bryobacteraceae bacterium]|nr:phosphatidate cytidylyltransferase [Bryobacteraceae bacterium]MCX7604009.1 phosphatidate cytidylyltransferase [Bryobacteraceae bacterium]